MNLNPYLLSTRTSATRVFASFNYISSTKRNFGRMASKASLERAEDFVSFLNASPTPYHAVASAKQRLEKAGFKQIKVCNSLSAELTIYVANSALPDRNAIHGTQLSTPAASTT